MPRPDVIDGALRCHCIDDALTGCRSSSYAYRISIQLTRWWRCSARSLGETIRAVMCRDRALLAPFSADQRDTWTKGQTP